MKIAKRQSIQYHVLPAAALHNNISNKKTLSGNVHFWKKTSFFRSLLLTLMHGNQTTKKCKRQKKKCNVHLHKYMHTSIPEKIEKNAHWILCVKNTYTRHVVLLPPAFNISLIGYSSKVKSHIDPQTSNPNETARFISLSSCLSQSTHSWLKKIGRQPFHTFGLTQSAYISFA